MEEQLQNRFIAILKDKLPPNVALVDEIADLLEVSNDSAYRRIRGETQLSLEEAAILSSEYGISIDSLVGEMSNTIPFSYAALDEANLNFREYLSAIRGDLKMINSFEDKEVIYVSNDISLFHILQIPEIAYFKFYFWQRTVLNFKAGEPVMFALSGEDEELETIRTQMCDLFNEIPSIDVINAETVDNTLKQIEYYWISGYFPDDKTPLMLCDKLATLMQHIKLQAEHGMKFNVGLKPTGRPETYKLYYNEVLQSDNSILVRMDDAFATYLTSNGLNMLSTTSQRFYQDTYQLVNHLLSKCSFISGTNEKERNRVFIQFQKKIDKLKMKIGE